jgi:hypothetical protein
MDTNRLWLLLACAGLVLASHGAAQNGARGATGQSPDGGSTAALTTIGPVWTQSSGTATWIPKAVSIGDSGTQVFADIDGFQGFARLFSSSDHSPATAVWQSANSYHTSSSRVASADASDLHVSLRCTEPQQGAASHAVVARYSSASSNPQWTYTFPFVVSQPPNGIAVSRDGSTIVAWVFDMTSFRTWVAVFSPSSSTPQSYTGVDTASVPTTAELSADGSTLYIAAASKSVLFDVHHGSVIQSLFNTEAISPAHAISGDGSVFAKGLAAGRVDVFHRQGASYSFWFSTQLGDAPTQAARLALSDDGATLVVGWAYTQQYLRVRVQALDLGAPQHPVVLDDNLQGAGAYQNTVSDLSISADGSHAAVGLSGDQAGLVPELLVYGRDADTSVWSRIYSYNLPGSVEALDLSADGTRVAVASKAVHINVLAGGGRIDLFDLAQRDLVLSGVPHAGSQVSMEEFAQPGSPARLLVAHGLAATPQPFGGMGILYLDPSTLSVAGNGSANGAGVVNLPLNLPNAPTMIGSSLYYQGLIIHPRHLTQDWVRVTVLP